MTLLRTAIADCRRASELAGGRCMVAFSGGKDSLVTLDLACQTFDHVEAFFYYFVRGLECVEAHLEAVAKRYGVKLHYFPHPSNAEMIRTAAFMPAYDGTWDRLRRLRGPDMARLIRHRTGIEWFAWGERCSDGGERATKIRRDGTVNTKLRFLYPIGEWKDGDVYAYIRAKKIPLPNRFGTGKTSGLGLDPADLAQLKRDWPNDYRKVEEVFPFVGALLAREELKKRGT